jgi:hypothetical protein
VNKLITYFGLAPENHPSLHQTLEFHSSHKCDLSLELDASRVDVNINRTLHRVWSELLSIPSSQRLSDKCMLNEGSHTAYVRFWYKRRNLPKQSSGGLFVKKKKSKNYFFLTWCQTEISRLSVNVRYLSLSKSKYVIILLNCLKIQTNPLLQARNWVHFVGDN